MAKRFIDTDLFKKRFIRGLRGPYKLLWIYLFCECDNAGIWEVDVQAAELFCGHKYTLADMKNAFAGRIHFFNADAKAFIPEFIEFQYGEVPLNSKNPAHKSVLSKLSKYQLFEVLREGAVKPQQSPFKGDMDMDKEMDKDMDKGGTGGKTKGAARFIPPTLEEVAAYCRERGNSVDPQQWFDYYAARGWKYKGGLVMKDWKAALRYWERNDFNTGDNGRKKTTGAGELGTVPGSPTKKTYTGTL
jgi:hypothetical protein